MGDKNNKHLGEEGLLYNSQNWNGSSYNVGKLDSPVLTENRKILPSFSNKAEQTKPNNTIEIQREQTPWWKKAKLLGQANMQNYTEQSAGVKTEDPPQKTPFKDKIKTFGQKTNTFFKDHEGLTDFANSALDIAKGFVPTQESKGKNPTGYETQQAIGDALTKFPDPMVKAAGVAYKGISMLAEATGTNTSMITKDQMEDLGISKTARIANNIIGTLSPFSGIVAGGPVEEGQKSHLIDEMSNAYADTVSDIDQAGMMGGGRYLFGKKKIEGAIAEANRRNELLTEMNMTNTMRKQSDYGRDLAQQNMNRYAGTNYMDMRMGRKGMKIQTLEEIREMIKNRVTENEDVQKFAEGGSLLPTGKLHKELNHLNELGEQFEDLTRKGIPVVTVDESGDMVQVAEIEHSEIILSKEITDQIESYWKDGSEEAMISAGKLLAEELLYNMKDDGGVLDGNNEGKN